MSRILYRAKSAGGDDVADFVEASSAAEAMKTLIGKGLKDIVLLQSPDLAAVSNAPLLGINPQQHARLRAELMEKPGLATALRGMIRINAPTLIVAVALIALGTWSSYRILTATGTAFLVLPFALFFWKRRHLDRYQALMKAYARGQWDEVRRIAPLLRSVTNSKLLPFDLDVRLACIEARQGRLEAAVAGLESWKAELVEAPGMFVARLAGVHFAAGDYRGYLELMEQAGTLGNQDPSRMVDVALANAKFGDVGRAQDILYHLDAKLLPPLGHKFVEFVNGLIRLRNDQPGQAVPHLQTAAQEFLESSLKSPAAWTALAICSGYLAVALARCGKRDAASQAIEDVLPILRVHGEKPLMDMLQNEVLKA